ncbi:MAG: polyphosphate kinase 1 [Planctomycetes bacterium]|nr:polyphosphate kinase 1 [Planctomycetota bacterium]
MDDKAGVAQRYFNRELSWLAFNRRVLEEAEDGAKPLLERTKFLAIVSSNLDEFVMVRLAELRGLARGEIPLERYVGEPKRDLVEVRAAMQRLVVDQYRCWNSQLRPALLAAGFQIVVAADWTDADRESLRKLYSDMLEPVLTPLAVDPTRPFPMLPNRGICVAVQLVPAAGGAPRNALIAVPGGNRVVALTAGSGRFALVEDVVMAFAEGLFPGYRISGRCLFRVTRDGSLDMDDDVTDGSDDQSTDLLSEIEQGLTNREQGQPVRLELVAGSEPGITAWLLGRMELDADEIVSIDGPLDLTALFALNERIGRDDLREPAMPALSYPPADEWEDPFARIRAGEFLLHHPFQAFQPVIDLVAAAAADPRVLAIKQTLYRVSGESPLVKSLIAAARAGKQVTVLIELKARFDEATNIRWARRLEDAGAHVIYGLVGYKVHAKLLMIIRRDDDGICRYVHLGTGNYNDKTARLYTDLSYFTANEAVGRDVAALFNMLTGYSRPPEFERLAVAPLNLRSSFNAWIRREAEHAKAGRPARIIAKFNSMVDQEICDELYAASQAGVQIDLIVRGMCILRPGVPGLSENIRVRSLVGRFLEHHRIYWFANKGEAKVTSRPVVAIASADWMSRNLDRRVECLVRIEDERLQERLENLLTICLEDNVQARVLAADGTYTRLQPGEDDPRPANERFRAEAASAAGTSIRRKQGAGFKPVRKPG